MPSDAASPGWEDDDAAARITRRPSRVARPGQTAALGMRVGSPVAGSEARTRASAAPSHPRRRLRARRTITTTTTQAMTVTTPASVQSTRGDAAKVCRRQAMRPPMTTRETRGAPRRREDPEKTPRPRRSMPGHVSARGRPRTSRVSPPRRTRLPGVSRLRPRSRCHPRIRVRTRMGDVSGDARRQARPPRVENSACSRATLAQDRGTSPALPTVPGARTRPTSGPSTHARCRSVRRAARARHLLSLIPPRFRRARASSSGGAHPVDSGATRKAPVDKCSGRARVWITPPAALVSVPNPDRDGCEMQEWTPCMTTRSRRLATATTTW